MKPILPTLLAFSLLSTALLPVRLQAIPSVYPTGVTRYDPIKAWNGYVLFSGADEHTHLIDMNGNEVRSWPRGGFPSQYIDPALVGGKRGHVLLTLEKKDPPKGFTSWGNGLANQAVGEVDWHDKVVWRWDKQAPGGSVQQHHEILRLANGNTLILANEIRTVHGFALPQLIGDVVYEVTPAGEVAWKWSALDRLEDYGFGAEQFKLVQTTDNADVLHLNNAKVIGPNRWYRAGDARFKPGNLLIDSRNANFIAIIDRDSGEVVWRLGPNFPKIDPKTAQKLPRPVDQIIGQHDAQLIGDGLPGAGNLLVFDNQGEAGYPRAAHSLIGGGSRVLEIDPVKNEIVWQYTAENSGQRGWGFFSGFISSARRLPNGNTLIDEGMNGRVFQVTVAGKIVWEYVSPYLSKPSAAKKARLDARSNAIYRAQPVPYTWAPEGTPRSEKAVTTPDLPTYRVAGS